MPGLDYPSDGSGLRPAPNDAPTSRLRVPVGSPDPTPYPDHWSDDRFPQPGDRFLYFDLVEEIGRGAFARVFLAKQESLANRLVVLKVTAAPTDEPQKLARLRHTNVVPVYSVHQAGPLQAVCMPYLGRTTLSRAMARLDARPGGRPGSGRELLSTLYPDGPAPGGPPVRIGPEKLPDRPAATATDTLEVVGRMSFVEASLWVVAQLAAGLAHAHGRGILHRDLKPGNVLITDDGVPMLLDFNVSAESPVRRADGRVGGTLPYMAPEHVRAFLGGTEAVGEPGDLYSLGVILYELLTGVALFPHNGTPRTPEAVAAVLDARKALPPPPSTVNPAVSPAVDAITLKLLEPTPERRYARAEDLREDLTCQLAHRPLAFAPDPSPRERFGKWRRRNPRLATALAVVAFALVFLVLPAGLAVASARESRREAADALRRAEEEKALLEARDLEARRTAAVGAFRTAVDDLRNAAVMLGSRTDPTFLDQGLGQAKDVLARYGVGNPGWEAQPGFTLLDDRQRSELRALLAEVLVLMTRAESRPGESPEAVAAAVRWNALAGPLFADADRPAVVARQREELEARRAGRPVPPFAASGAPRDADLYFDGLDLAAADRFREALPLLAKFCDRHPGHFSAWFARGICHDALGQPADASAAFTVCVTLRPDFPQAHFNRGLARLKTRRDADAETDFTRALELKPGWVPALLNRGLARERLRRFRDAEADFTAALAGPGTPTRLFFLRSRVRVELGDKPGAEADRAEGLAREPADALSWATRGTRRMAKEPQAAISDFDAALRLSPALADALLNKAVVLAEYLNRTAEAIPVLDRLLELYPEHVEGRSGRAMCFARLGRADEARKDAAACLAADRSAYRHYQMAGLYAQLAKADATGASRAEALRLLGRALRTGFADWKLLNTDTDLDPIRGDPAFKALTTAAAELDRAGKK
jgi:serine/threonine protein kinase/lipoprotein NlpI